MKCIRYAAGSGCKRPLAIKLLTSTQQTHSLEGWAHSCGRCGLAIPQQLRAKCKGRLDGTEQSSEPDKVHMISPLAPTASFKDGLGTSEHMCMHGGFIDILNSERSVFVDGKDRIVTTSTAVPLVSSFSITVADCERLWAEAQSLRTTGSSVCRELDHLCNPRAALQVVAGSCRRAN